MYVTCLQMMLDSASNPVYSDEQVTAENLSFKHDLILSPTSNHIYALTAQQVCQTRPLTAFSCFIVDRGNRLPVFTQLAP